MKLCLFLALFFFLIIPAHGHNHWISNSKYKDPQHGWDCCGERDCHPLEKHEVRVTQQGYVIIATGELVPWRRVIASEPDTDGEARYYVCRWPGDGFPDKEYRCFFAPFGGS